MKRDEIPDLEGDDDVPPLDGDEDFIVEERYEDDGEEYSDLGDDFDDENEEHAPNAKVYVAPDKQYTSRMIDQQFDRFNEEFDDDDIGELDNEDPSIKGSLNVNDISSYLEEFLQEYRPKPLKPQGRLVEESDVSLLTHNVEAIDLGSDSDIDNEELDEKFVDYPYLAAAFKPKPEVEFDCESIISAFLLLFLLSFSLLFSFHSSSFSFSLQWDSKTVSLLRSIAFLFPSNFHSIHDFPVLPPHE